MVGITFSASRPASRVAAARSRIGVEAGVNEGRRPGDLERLVMDALQHAGRPLTPREVHRRLGIDLAYNTVQTLAAGKGLVERQEVGRSFAYRPVAVETGLAVRRLFQVLDERPDRDGVLVRFLGSLSRSGGELLRRQLDELNRRDTAEGDS
jgi:predicted transcriptional regulator